MNDVAPGSSVTVFGGGVAMAQATEIVASLGTPGGGASLDGAGHVPLSELTNAIVMTLAVALVFGG